MHWYTLCYKALYNDCKVTLKLGDVIDHVSLKLGDMMDHVNLKLSDINLKLERYIQSLHSLDQ